MDKNTFKNASFVLAGGACLLMIAGHFFHSPDGALPIKGFRFVAALAIPTLCFWVGMLLRHLCGKVKWWALAVAAVLAGVSFYLSRHTVNNLGWSEIRFLWYFLMLAGFLLPQDYLYDRRDKEGIKSFVLLVITALFYGSFELYWGRVYPFCMKPQFEDMAVLLMVVTTNMIPLAALLPVFFAAEFSLSNPAQWLGGQKWFRWIVGIAAFICFCGSLSGVFAHSPLFFFSLNRKIQFFVQPFTIYLIIVICRIIRKLWKKEMTWKEVFAI